MSVDSLRIEDIYRGTEAEVVNHFSNKNKTIQQLQDFVGTLAVSTDTNRVMIFTGPTAAGTHTRGDFSWSTFASDTTYTLDDSVVAQYNPFMWFDASHVSEEYLSGGEGSLRDSIRNSDINQIPTVRPLILDGANNGGSDIQYGDFHIQQYYAPAWNAYPGGNICHYGIKVNPNKFLKHHQDADIWMSAVTGQDHGYYAAAPFYAHPTNNPDKIEDRAAVQPAGHKLAMTAAALNWAGTRGGKIVHRDGHKYLRQGHTNTTTGPIADCSFMMEFGVPNESYTQFQIVRKAPAYGNQIVPLVRKAGYSDACLYGEVTGSSFAMGGMTSTPANGQAYATWRDCSTYSTANNHFLWSKATGASGAHYAGHSYTPAWGFDAGHRPQIHNTSVGGGNGVGTLTFDYDTLKAEVAANGLTTLQGNILEIDNNNMPDNVITHEGTYNGTQVPLKDWHVLASADKPIGWQTCYIPKGDQPQMRVSPGNGGVTTHGSFLEERINGFGQTYYRNDYQSYMLRASVDAGNGHDGGNYTARWRGDVHAKNMFDRTKDGGMLFNMGNINGTHGGRYGTNQNAGNTIQQNYHYEMDIAEVIIVPTPGTFSAYKAMVANIEGYLAAKYGIQQDCSLDVPA